MFIQPESSVAQRLILDVENQSPLTPETWSNWLWRHGSQIAKGSAALVGLALIGTVGYAARGWFGRWQSVATEGKQGEGSMVRTTEVASANTNPNALESPFAAEFNLTDLDGTNGFKLLGAASDYTGDFVSSAGDLNGDGIPDLSIGSQCYGVCSGKNYVIFGKNTSWISPMTLSSLTATDGFYFNGAITYARMGVSSCAVDFNGDGITDFILGASQEHPNSYGGAVYIIFGKTGSWGNSFSVGSLNGANGFKFLNEGGWNYCGNSVAGIGDINGDGISDLLIGAFGGGSTSSYPGKSYVLFGSRNAWSSTFAPSSLNGVNGFKINGEQGGDDNGYSVASAGDINGDGIPDIIIGAPCLHKTACDGSGKSYVIFGKNNSTTWGSTFSLLSLDGTNGFRILGEAANDYSGCSVSSAGDINGDGISDIIIGAYNASPDGSRANAGKSYVIFGHSGIWNSTIYLANLDGINGFKIYGEVAGDNSGSSIASVGDSNGDGICDFMIGARMASPYDRTNAGRSYVVYGHRGVWNSVLDLSNLDGTNGFKLNGEAANDRSGTSVASAKDMNGDGIQDIIIGAHGANSNAGKAYVIFGRQNYDTSLQIVTNQPIENCLVCIGNEFDLTLNSTRIFYSPLGVPVIKNVTLANGGVLPNWLSYTPTFPSITTSIVGHRPMPGSGERWGLNGGVALSGNYVFATGQCGLQVVNATNPADPQIVGSYPAVLGSYPGDCCGNAIAIFGHYAYFSYMVAGSQAMRVVDISNPANPTLVKSISSINTGIYGITIKDNYLYMGRSSGGCFTIANISDPANPAILGTYTTGDSAGKNAILGNYAYVTERTKGLVIVDISNPNSPTYAGMYQPSATLNCGGMCYGNAVTIIGNYIYATFGCGLQILDASTPTNLQLLGSIYINARLGLEVIGDKAFIADWNYGLQIVDVSDPHKPTLLKTVAVDGYGYDLAIKDNYVFITAYTAEGGLQIIKTDISPTTLYALNGTPQAGDIGVQQIKVTGTNGVSEAADIFQLSVSSCLPVVNIPLVSQTSCCSAGIGEQYNFVFANSTFTDPDSDALTYTASKADGFSLPSWLNFNATARAFSGVPNDANQIGSLNITVIARDPSSANISDIFTLNILKTLNASNTETPIIYTRNVPYNLIDIVISTPSNNVNTQLIFSNSTAGRLNTGTSGAVTSIYNLSIGAWIANGNLVDVNNLLAGLVYQPATNYRNPFNITLSVTDDFSQSLVATIQASPMIPPFVKAYGGTGDGAAYSIQQVRDNGYVMVGCMGSGCLILKLDDLGNKIWGKVFAGSSSNALSIQQTADDGYVFASTIPGNYNDMYIFKLDSAGNKMWANKVDGGSFDNAYSALQTADGGYILAGCFINGVYKALIVKFDDLGNKIWAKMYSDGYDYLMHSTVQTKDDGFIMAGYTSAGAGNNDFSILKLDSSGNKIWARTFGGSGADIAQSVQQTNDDGYIIVGYTYSAGAGSYDVLILKLDDLGNQVWAKTFGGVDGDAAYSVQQTNDNGYIVVGYTQSIGAGSDDVLILKTGNLGNKVWAKTFGGIGSDVAFSIQQTTDGGYILAGRTSSVGVGGNDVLIIKLDSDGTVKSDGCFGQQDVSWNTTDAVLTFGTRAGTTSDAPVTITPSSLTLSNWNPFITVACSSVPSVSFVLQSQIGCCSASIGVPYNFTFAANTFDDPDSDPLTYSATKTDGSLLPGWLTFTSLTRKFSGVPTNSSYVGNLDIKVIATDPFGEAAIDIFTLRIEFTDINHTPILTVNQLTISEGQSIILTASNFNATDPDDPSGTGLMRTLMGHTSDVRCVAMNHQGDRIISGSNDNTIKIWDATSGTCLNTLIGHSRAVSSVAYNPSGDRIVSGSYDFASAIKIWDATSGICLNTLAGHTSYAISVAYNPFGNRIISGSYDSTIKIWDATSGTCLNTLVGHTSAIISLAYNSQGDRIVSGSADSTIKIWDAMSGTCLITLGHTNAVTSVFYNSQGNRIVSGSLDNTIKIWDATSGTCLNTLTGLASYVYSVANAQGDKIVSGSGDKTIRIWDTTSGACLRTFLSGHTSYVQSVAFNPVGDMIISGGGDNSIKIWTAQILSFTVNNTQHGYFERISAPGNSTTTFALQEIQDGKICFVHDGSKTAPSYDVAVSDGIATTEFATAVINFTNLNNEPTLTANTLTINENQAIILTTNNFNATDPDTIDSNLTFTISNLQHGEFKVSGSTVTSFTLEQIKSGVVSFVHDGSVNAPSYSAAVSDGSQSTAAVAATIIFDCAPTLFANQLTITQGQSIVLSRSNLYVEDREQGSTLLTFTISNIQHGHFERITAAGTPIISFILTDIQTGQIRFVHDGSVEAPSYAVSVSDGRVSTTAMAATIVFNCIVPVLTVNQLNVSQGETILLTTANFNATEEGHAATALTFNISGIQHGYFEKVSAVGTAITDFTLQEIQTSQIRFVHDGSTSAPSYQVSVSDGTISTAAVSAVISFNDRPVLVVNQLTVTQGQSIILTVNNLLIADTDQSAASLVFMISNMQHGSFERISAAGTVITNFTLQEIQNSQIRFVHDGSTTSPSYSVAASDGIVTSPAQATTVTFSVIQTAAPSIITNQLTITQNQTVILTSSMLNAQDTDTVDSNLMFTVSNIQHGQFKIAGATVTNFTQAQVKAGAVSFVHDGSPTAPSYQISVSDGTTSTIPATSLINFSLINQVPSIITNRFVLDRGSNYITVTQRMLLAQDANRADTDSVLTFLISNIRKGYFELSNDEGTVVTSFTQQQIKMGQVRLYLHDNSRGLTFNISVTDGKAISVPVSANVTYIGWSAAEQAGVGGGVGGGALVIGGAVAAIGFFAYRRRKQQQQRIVPILSNNIPANSMQIANALFVPGRAPQALVVTESVVQKSEADSNKATKNNTTSSSIIVGSTARSEISSTPSSSSSSSSITTIQKNCLQMITSEVQQDVIKRSDSILNISSSSSSVSSSLVVSFVVSEPVLTVDQSLEKINSAAVSECSLNIPTSPSTVSSSAIPAEKLLEVLAVAKLSEKVCEKPESQSGFGRELRGSSGVVTPSLISPIIANPILTANHFNLDSDDNHMIISRKMLAALIPEADSSEIIFSISNIKHGHFELFSCFGKEITTFTQRQINSFAVILFYDDSNELSFDLSVRHNETEVTSASASIRFNAAAESNTPKKLSTDTNNVDTITIPTLRHS